MQSRKFSEAANAAPILYFQNQGSTLVATNYWSTPSAKAGMFFLSFAGTAARLLVPNQNSSALAELTTDIDHVVVTVGDAGRGIEATWQAEDGTDTPFQIHLGRAHVLTPAIPPGCLCPIVASVWIERRGQPSLRAAYPAFLRFAEEYPNTSAIPNAVRCLIPQMREALRNSTPLSL